MAVFQSLDAYWPGLQVSGILIIITAYTMAFPQSGSSSAGIQVISASDIGQATSTGEIPLLFSRTAVGSLKSPILVSRGWETRSVV